MWATFPHSHPRSCSRKGPWAAVYRNQALYCWKKTLLLILHGPYYSLSESALSECHYICAAGSTVFQISQKMIQILINHADKTINIPTACSTYYLSLLTKFQLNCSTLHGCSLSVLEPQCNGTLHLLSNSNTCAGSGPQWKGLCGAGNGINVLPLPLPHACYTPSIRK